VRLSRAHAALVNTAATAAATSAYAAAVTMPHSSANSNVSSVEVHHVEVQLQAVEDEYLSSLGDAPPALPPGKLVEALKLNSADSIDSSSSALLEVLHVQGNSAWLRVQLPLQLWYEGFACCDSSAVYDAAAAVSFELAVTEDSSSSSSSLVYPVEVVLPVSAYT
jgi:hypothetical protein